MTDIHPELRKYQFSYKFQGKDERDHTTEHSDGKLILKTSKATLTKVTQNILPAIFTIPILAPIMDQGDIGDCVANSASYLIYTQTPNRISISRIMLYDLCRIIENTPLSQDDGTTIRTAANVLLKYGCCLESTYPYNVNTFSVFPPFNVLKQLNLFKQFFYFFVNQDLISLKNTLTTMKTPITFGIIVYESFLTTQVAKTGIVPMPDTKKEQLVGGHCVTMVGYDDSKQAFYCANSWGTTWGKKGYFYLPYKYVTDPNLASDFCYYKIVY
jgi:C1A family cysteine protease